MFICQCFYHKIILNIKFFFTNVYILNHLLFFFYFICIERTKVPHSLWDSEVHVILVQDSSGVRRLFSNLLEPWDVRELYIRKTADLSLQLCVDTFPRFVAIRFYFLSKTLHQSFFYSFIPSESGVTLHYSMILPYTIISPC